MPAMHSPKAAPQDPTPTWVVCLAGAIGLVVAMGIGRFAFTPLLPLMQRDGLLGADGSAGLAAANYVGYLIGAFSAARLPGGPRARLLGALAATALLTAATGWATGYTAWLLLRLAAGVASAWALVSVSGWAVPVLAQRGRPEAGGVVFAGVGLGIALAGGWVWLFSGLGAQALWRHLGVLAAVLALAVALLWQRATPTAAAGPSAVAAPAVPRGSLATVLCYGMLGFGYILPATYLPAQARALIDDPRLFGLVWPVFGLAAAASTLLAGRALKRWHRLRLWAISHALMAAGCALPLLSLSGPAVTLAALLVGGTFMVATMAGLQQARALAVANPTPLLARMTAAFALGQIAGPLVALALARLGPPGGTGIEATLVLATGGLLASAAWLHRNTPTLETHHAHESAAGADRAR